MRFQKKTPRNIPDTVSMAAAVMKVTQNPIPERPAPAPRSPSPQIIEDRYIDDDKLLELCSKRFPLGSYRLSWKFNKWYLDAPDWLDEASRSTAIHQGASLY
ncbi:hypothetical protein BU25DRAFT_461491 [Macroventuria anomochaeta]|uniref:Uncharacterized protein n=1 Tax=Macroventuria anomochaeta TaxID=301207 RepID=A0ACB6RPL6_9PLEO|nr:uncharacterized protein BU25DRAFT_461491 [Macroventuria anomochaeta]KAF2623991.1 hypothetical protein BU25DRAFT_461491 [Macroventuria anomochaeta]